MFLLEVRYAASHGSINRDGHFQTDLSGLEAHVIDGRRFEERSRFFAFSVQGGKPGPSARPLSRDAGCLACHTKSAAVETTFVQFYPTLLERGWPDAEKALAAARAEDEHGTLASPAVLNQLGYCARPRRDGQVAERRAAQSHPRGQPQAGRRAVLSGGAASTRRLPRREAGARVLSVSRTSRVRLIGENLRVADPPALGQRPPCRWLPM